MVVFVLTIFNFIKMPSMTQQYTQEALDDGEVERAQMEGVFLGLSERISLIGDILSSSFTEHNIGIGVWRDAITAELALLALADSQRSAILDIMQRGGSDLIDCLAPYAQRCLDKYMSVLTHENTDFDLVRVGIRTVLLGELQAIEDAELSAHAGKLSLPE